MQRKPKKADLIRQPPLSSTTLFSLRAKKVPRKTEVTIVVPVRLFPKAVQRNRIRRQVREAVLKVPEFPKTGWNIVLSVRSQELPKGEILQKELFAVLKKSGIVSR